MSTHRKLLVVLGVLALLAATIATVALAATPSTGTNVACATASVPDHTLGVDSTPVYTITGTTTSSCNTVTYTIPTSTETSTTTETSTVTSTVTASTTTATAPPDWTGTFGAIGAPISSSLYPFQSFVAGHVTTVADPKGSGAGVASFAINGSDAPYSGAPPRGDIYSSFTFLPGMDKYISIPLYTPPAGLPTTISTGSGQWLLTSQLAIPGGNAQPQLTWSVTSDGMIGHAAPGGIHWSMFLRSPQNGQIWTGPTIDDGWHTLIVHVKCESTNGGTDGSVELWYDGAKQTLYNGAQILSGIRILEQANDLTSYKASLGLDSYRNKGLIAGTYTLYHGIPKIGPTYASVQ